MVHQEYFGDVLRSMWLGGFLGVERWRWRGVRNHPITLSVNHGNHCHRPWWIPTTCVLFHVQPWWIRKPANSSDSSEPFDIILTRGCWFGYGSKAAWHALAKNPWIEHGWIIQSSQLLSHPNFLILSPCTLARTSKSAMKGDLLLSKKNTCHW